MQVLPGQRLMCLRCGHEWHTRSERTPVQCPRCKSPSWERPRSGHHGARRGKAPSFSEISAFGIWAGRTETDDELLAELGSGWGDSDGEP